MDAALRPLFFAVSLIEKCGFNPCFDGCRPATLSPVLFYMRSYHLVSILVLMDAALRPCRPLCLACTPTGFNPCFDGCRPATFVLINENDMTLWFQSLF